jgi:plasmid rolling circle replication initiator protein Rep
MTANDGAASPVYLSDESPKDKPWDVHRGQAEAVERLYELGGYERYAERIKGCSNRLQYAVDKSAESVVFRLKSAQFCRVRFCPVCQWRRSLMWVARFLDALPKYLEDHPRLVPLYLTLTVKNCHLSDLRATVQTMNAAFKRLTERKAWPAVGWVKSMEVTKGKDGPDMAHPHFHVLLFVRPGYFKGGEYIKAEQWRELWQHALRAEYLPVVNVKRVKAKGKTQKAPTSLAELSGAIVETLKYSVKPDELVADSEFLYQVTEQLHKVRAVAVGGNLRPYLKNLEDDGNLITEKIDAELEDDAPRIVFDWATEVKRYAKRN